MGFFSNLTGNASELNAEDLEADFADVIYDGETVEAAFKIFRDKWVFTNKRLIVLDVQGLTGKKKEYHSIPYKSITQFLVETAGNFDSDAELKIWLSGQGEPLQYELSSGVDVVSLQKTLAKNVCK
ncbi:PH domain-containing protein [Flammeovirga sp. EKP202]|uniref:PH domain-containing protein n=1 Tax=Flammeovirga sp. EKP202 TaxID=2770592 RepID=UPI00165F98A0|nr:PH domain-containing protein [Flammeovirga sp. EKP202]MBD0404306.1 PH domain-containing protein [Flammeovirga sp. EKP202]